MISKYSLLDRPNNLSQDELDHWAARETEAWQRLGIYVQAPPDREVEQLDRSRVTVMGKGQLEADTGGLTTEQRCQLIQARIDAVASYLLFRLEKTSQEGYVEWERTRKGHQRSEWIPERLKGLRDYCRERHLRDQKDDFSLRLDSPAQLPEGDVTSPEWASRVGRRLQIQELSEDLLRIAETNRRQLHDLETEANEVSDFFIGLTQSKDSTYRGGLEHPHLHQMVQYRLTLNEYFDQLYAAHLQLLKSNSADERDQIFVGPQPEWPRPLREASELYRATGVEPSIDEDIKDDQMRVARFAYGREGVSPPTLTSITDTTTRFGDLQSTTLVRYWWYFIQDPRTTEEARSFFAYRIQQYLQSTPSSDEGRRYQADSNEFLERMLERLKEIESGGPNVIVQHMDPPKVRNIQEAEATAAQCQIIFQSKMGWLTRLLHRPGYTIQLRDAEELVRDRQTMKGQFFVKTPSGLAYTHQAADFAKLEGLDVRKFYEFSKPLAYQDMTIVERKVGGWFSRAPKVDGAEFSSVTSLEMGFFHRSLMRQILQGKEISLNMELQYMAMMKFVVTRQGNDPIWIEKQRQANALQQRLIKERRAHLDVEVLSTEGGREDLATAERAMKEPINTLQIQRRHLEVMATTAVTPEERAWFKDKGVEFDPRSLIDAFDKEIGAYEQSIEDGEDLLVHFEKLALLIRQIYTIIRNQASQLNAYNTAIEKCPFKGRPFVAALGSYLAFTNQFPIQSSDTAGRIATALGGSVRAIRAYTSIRTETNQLQRVKFHQS
jgi:hypothetical protein